MKDITNVIYVNLVIEIYIFIWKKVVSIVTIMTGDVSIIFLYFCLLWYQDVLS